MPKFEKLTSSTVVLPIDNVDTDQICPARFLKTTKRVGLGAALFADWRYLPDGTPRPDFPLNQPGAAGANVLVAGENFGCGSSREHAPWALLDYGFRAVVSTAIADIFRGNALKNGLLPVVVEKGVYLKLLESPGAAVTIDLDSQTLEVAGEVLSFHVDPFARYCLLRGIDELGFLLDRRDAIESFERRYIDGRAR